MPHAFSTVITFHHSGNSPSGESQKCKVLTRKPYIIHYKGETVQYLTFVQRPCLLPGHLHAKKATEIAFSATYMLSDIGRRVHLWVSHLGCTVLVFGLNLPMVHLPGMSEPGILHFYSGQFWGSKFEAICLQRIDRILYKHKICCI